MIARREPTVPPPTPQWSIALGATVPSISVMAVARYAIAVPPPSGLGARLPGFRR